MVYVGTWPEPVRSSHWARVSAQVVWIPHLHITPQGIEYMNLFTYTLLNVYFFIKFGTSNHTWHTNNPSFKCVCSSQADVFSCTYLQWDTPHSHHIFMKTYDTRRRWHSSNLTLIPLLIFKGIQMDHDIGKSNHISDLHLHIHLNDKALSICHTHLYIAQYINIFTWCKTFNSPSKKTKNSYLIHQPYTDINLINNFHLFFNIIITCV